MDRVTAKHYHRAVRKRRIRKKVQGSALRPRITGYRSNRFLFVQAIDDEAGLTLASVTNLGKHSSEKAKSKGSRKSYVNCDIAQQLGEALGAKLKNNDIKSAVFDCNGYRYHGIVKAVAEGVRKTGIAF